jgi:hypothetical protein
MRSDRERLEDILEAIDRIEKYAALGEARFQTDELVQNWITHHIQIIGEACRSLTPEFKKAPSPHSVGRNYRHAEYSRSRFTLELIWGKFGKPSDATYLR